MTLQGVTVIREKKFYMKVRLADIGPGGWECACCSPYWPKARTKHIRIVKKRERRLFRDLIEEALKKG